MHQKHCPCPKLAICFYYTPLFAVVLCMHAIMFVQWVELRACHMHQTCTSIRRLLTHPQTSLGLHVYYKLWLLFMLLPLTTWFKYTKYRICRPWNQVNTTELYIHGCMNSSRLLFSMIFFQNVTGQCTSANADNPKCGIEFVQNPTGSQTVLRVSSMMVAPPIYPTVCCIWTSQSYMHCLSNLESLYPKPTNFSSN